MWNTSGRSLIPLSTRSTSLTTGSCSISTSRTIPKPSPVKRCWVRVLWTMLHHIPRPFGLGIFCGGRYRTRTARAERSEGNQSPSRALISARFPTRRNVYQERCRQTIRSGDFFVVDGTGLEQHVPSAAKAIKALAGL